MDKSEFKQSIPAAIMGYILLYKFFLAVVTLGFIALRDYLNYRNTILSLNNKFIVYKTGAFTVNSKEIPKNHIAGVSLTQSFLGQIFNYGTVTVIMSGGSSNLIIKDVCNPQAVCDAVQQKYVEPNKTLIEGM